MIEKITVVDEPQQDDPNHDIKPTRFRKIPLVSDPFKVETTKDPNAIDLNHLYRNKQAHGRSRRDKSERVQPTANLASIKVLTNANRSRQSA